MCSSSIDDSFFLSTDFTDFTDFCYAGLNLRFNFLTSDFTDLTDVGYAFGFGRDDEGARENTSRGESRTITNSVVLLK